MRILFLISIAFVSLLLSEPSAYASRRKALFRSSSIEWKTDISDIVIIGLVQSTTPIDSPNENWRLQRISCKPLESIKGKWDKSLSLRHSYSLLKKVDKVVSSRVKNGQRLLLFLRTHLKTESVSVEDWVNLTSPEAIPRISTKAAYDNGFRLLTQGSDILALVRKRVADKHVAKRGLIVVQNVETDGYHDFVMTAEPRYRERFVEQLKSGNESEKCLAIYNLVSYPSNETKLLIRPYLRDKTTARVQNYIGDGKSRDITYYPVQQAAYRALVLLDDNPPIPKPYYSGIVSREFDTGFENKTYFPVRKWKRKTFNGNNPFRAEKAESN